MISLNFIDDDILSSPEFSVLVHICNAYENWDKGIGKKLKSVYKYAHYTYDIHCNGQGYVVYDTSSDDMCLLIPPCEPDSSLPKHWIACMLIGTVYRENNSDTLVVLEKLEEVLKELIDEVVISRLEGSTIFSIKISRSELGYLGVREQDFIKVIDRICLPDPHKVTIDLLN